jgi:hypothetical protein
MPVKRWPALLTTINTRINPMKKVALFIALIGALSACNTIHSVARDANTAVQAWNEDYQRQNNR